MRDGVLLGWGLESPREIDGQEGDHPQAETDQEAEGGSIEEITRPAAVSIEQHIVSLGVKERRFFVAYSKVSGKDQASGNEMYHSRFLVSDRLSVKMPSQKFSIDFWPVAGYAFGKFFGGFR